MREITRLILIRHALALHGGRLAGRRDVDADLTDVKALGRLRDWLAGQDVTRVVSSPARRCVQTALALFPGAEFERDPRLWEQNFGAWEGVPFAELPDLGPLSQAELAAHRPPGGESFDDVCARVVPVLEGFSGVVTVVAHAGVIRAALALGPAALRCEVAPLSVTVLTGGAGATIACVNKVP